MNVNVFFYASIFMALSLSLINILDYDEISLSKMIIASTFFGFIMMQIEIDDKYNCNNRLGD